MSAVMYTVGTLVLYDRRGVYEVESTQASPLPQNDGCMYYKLRAPFSSSNEVIYIPVDTAAFMRPLIGESEVSAYFELSSRLEPKVFSARKTMDLAAHYRGMLASCRLEDCLLLIKEIYTKQKNLASQSKKLGQVDQQYLKLAERLVCEDFAAVLHTTPDEIKKRLYAAMRRKTPGAEQASSRTAVRKLDAVSVC